MRTKKKTTHTKVEQDRGAGQMQMYQTNSRQEQREPPWKVAIPDEELQFTFARSSGPGGQNVNKTSTKAVLAWDFMASHALTLEQKHQLLRDSRIKARTNKEGVLKMEVQEERSQSMNKEVAAARLHLLIHDVLAPKEERRATKVPHGQKVERRKEKTHRARIKSTRRYRGEE